MSKTIVTQTPVRLEGYQAVFQPSKFGNLNLSCIVDETVVEQLEATRSELIEWCKSKVKNPRRSVCKPEPWEEVSQGMYQVKFKWSPDSPVPIVDSEGTPITEEIPLYSGSLVKVAFRQKPYTLLTTAMARLLNCKRSKSSKLVVLLVWMVEILTRQKPLPFSVRLKASKRTNRT